MASTNAFTASSGDTKVFGCAFAVAADDSGAESTVAAAQTSAKISGRSRAFSERVLGDLIVPTSG